ncbi:branched-chain amino acid aminotransferase [Nocardia pseudobrasiliensis]|uniref:branched-chain-amino-acid transaminase n=1 Tax=Nocardia pseudobrasiliensis TaxID=45979 RepID=A0A370I2L2_9NOCA|nr:branched-chain amino acid aminotransferase [Nocardia pseudobrasiliensis]RDI64979.1 branched-chain amino acid aminotransferase [Nocardia pseudobrasiliensis]
METTLHNSAATAEAGPVRNLGHGEDFTAHMFSARWSEQHGWHDAGLRAIEYLSLHPATVGLHYGQVAFEGLKAHRQVDGKMGVFRPLWNADRFRRSARRLAMPEIPEELFLRAVEELVVADRSCLPEDLSRSLYLRPLLFATDVSLMLRPAREYRFLLMAFVAGGFFGDDTESISVWVDDEYSRAFPGGTGDVKIAGNYAPTFVAQQRAQQADCQQVLWLDAMEHRWLEELGGMNVFLVRGRGADAEVITPELTGTLLPGATRDSILTLASRLGYAPREERISLNQLRTGCANGEISEMFACGTAAVVTPVRRICEPGGQFTVGDGPIGPVTRELCAALTGVQRGTVPDVDRWVYRIER